MHPCLVDRAADGLSTPRAVATRSREPDNVPWFKATAMGWPASALFAPSHLPPAVRLQSLLSLHLLASDCGTSELYGDFYVAPLYAVLPGHYRTWESLGQLFEVAPGLVSAGEAMCMRP